MLHSQIGLRSTFVLPVYVGEATEAWMKEIIQFIINYNLMVRVWFLFSRRLLEPFPPTGGLINPSTASLGKVLLSFVYLFYVVR